MPRTTDTPVSDNDKLIEQTIQLLMTLKGLDPDTARHYGAAVMRDVESAVRSLKSNYPRNLGVA